MAPSCPSLLLLRHGIADERQQGQADGDRALTAAGRHRTKSVLEKALALGLGVERLIASPLVRARQTAEIAVAVGLAPALELATALEPGGDPLPLLASWLASDRGTNAVRPSSQSLALVGHGPDLGDLAARLLGAPAGSIGLRKAGLVLLQWSGPQFQDPFAPEAGTSLARPELGQWQLQLLLAPRILLS
jgi:phosphohistidine phosphatase